MQTYYIKSLNITQKYTNIENIEMYIINIIYSRIRYLIIKFIYLT